MRPAAAEMTCIVFAAVEVMCDVLADMSLLIFNKM